MDIAIRGPTFRKVALLAVPLRVRFVHRQQIVLLCAIVHNLHRRPKPRAPHQRARAGELGYLQYQRKLIYIYHKLCGW